MRHDLLVLFTTVELETAEILLTAEYFSIRRPNFEVRDHMDAVYTTLGHPPHPDGLGVDDKRLARPKHAVGARLVDTESFRRFGDELYPPHSQRTPCHQHIDCAAERLHGLNVLAGVSFGL